MATNQGEKWYFEVVKPFGELVFFDIDTYPCTEQKHKNPWEYCLIVIYSLSFTLNCMSDFTQSIE
jgi:hypothetical protein